MKKNRLHAKTPNQHSNTQTPAYVTTSDVRTQDSSSSSSVQLHFFELNYAANWCSRRCPLGYSSMWTMFWCARVCVDVCLSRVLAQLSQRIINTRESKWKYTSDLMANSDVNDMFLWCRLSFSKTESLWFMQKQYETMPNDRNFQSSRHHIAWR